MILRRKVRVLMDRPELGLLILEQPLVRLPVSGKGSFMITTDGKGGYTVAVDIMYTFSDNYRWHNGRGDSGDEELVDHSKMNSLQSLGAKNFYIKAYYIQGVSGSNGSLDFTEK